MEKEVLEARIKQAQSIHQNLLQEAFRLEGEIRCLVKILKEQEEKKASE